MIDFTVLESSRSHFVYRDRDGEIWWAEYIGTRRWEIVDLDFFPWDKFAGDESVASNGTYYATITVNVFPATARQIHAAYLWAKRRSDRQVAA